jgi:hypothetical protein|tara:strand:- start:5899 stop:6495 length:597 start_codon:yes stop_codon:yes gene_type:complete
MIIPIRALARVVLGIALDGARDTAKEEARKRILESQFPAVKALLAEQLAQSYSEYVKDLSVGYVEAVAAMEMEVSANDDEGQKLVVIAENALRELEIFLEKQDQEGPIITYLKRRYEEEGVKQITGRLYAGHLVGRQSEGVYKIYNRMAYAPLVDKNKPWLSSETTAQGIGEVIAQKADEIFQQAFDVDLSGEDILKT